MDINQCRFTGKVTEIRQIKTKTGTTMASLTFQCWKEKIRAVLFKELAEQALQSFSPGYDIDISGRLETTSWQHEGKTYRGFQIVAEKISNKLIPSMFGAEGKQASSLDSQRLSEFQYQGGPF